jgi:hypothetical protein
MEEDTPNNIIIPYKCIRCDYTTKDKRNMRNHFNRQKPCPGKKNDIELTEFIKEKILSNRIYIIPKVIKQKNPKVVTETKTPKKSKEIISSTEYRHYFYLIRGQEQVNHSLNIYTFGQTKVKEYFVNVPRLLGYGNGSELILVIKCKNSLELERLVRPAFNKTFEKHIYGSESFIGDENEMTELINKIHFQMVKKEKVEKDIINTVIIQEN